MLAAAHLLRDMAVPENSPGSQQLVRLRDDDAAHRTLFEKAVRGFFAHTLRHTGWQVRSPHLLWSCAAQPTPPYLPTMKTDTVLDNAADARRIVVETKFSDSLVDHHGKSIVKTAHLYQLYAYLASQTGRGDALAEVAEGVLLFVKVEQREVFEGQFGIQGHRIRFLSVDLGAEPADIRQRFMRCIEPTNV